MSKQPYDPYPRKVIYDTRPGREGISPYSINPYALKTSNSPVPYGVQRATAEQERQLGTKPKFWPK